MLIDYPFVTKRTLLLPQIQEQTINLNGENREDIEINKFLGMQALTEINSGCEAHKIYKLMNDFRQIDLFKM